MAEATRIQSNTSNILNKGEYGYPLGHLGHLTDVQTRALEDFRGLAAENKLYTPATGDKPASHDDVTLLRYLRARRFIPQDALGQFRDTEKWRKANEIDNLYENIDVNEFEETRKLYPQWTGRRDKRGLPVYVFEVAHLNSKTMSAYAKSAASTTVLNSKLEHKDIPPRLYRLFALYENLTNFIMPLCTNLRDRENPQTPISQANNIVDISGVGLKQFWNLRSHMQDASILATAHYPETLDRIFIVGAPSFFPTVWSWIKRWFDPITTSKIFILSSDTAYATLSKFVDPENIPKKYGGKLPFEFGNGPILEQSIQDHLQWKDGSSWPKGPVEWVPKPDGTWDFLAVGSEEKKERRQVLATFNPDPVPENAETMASTIETKAPNGTAVEPVPSATTVPGTVAPATVVSASTDAPVEKASDPTANAAAKTEPVPLVATATDLPQQTTQEKKELTAPPA